MSVYLGIDPGVNGALAFFGSVSGKLDVFDMPCEVVKTAKGTKRRVSALGIAALVRPRKPDFATVERVSAAPVQGRKQGTTSMFSFGAGYGCIQGVLAGLGIDTDFVAPQRWKAALGLLKADKDASRVMAQTMFPDSAETFRLKKHDGRAEAALIALFAAQEIPV